MIGKTISHYKILEKLGEGGMGVVYKAEDTKLGRIVALKFLPSELTRDAEAKKRFIQEAKAASALDHPNICNVHEIDETADGRTFIAMACYDGESLKAKIERGPLRLEEALDIAAQVAQGLAKAHGKGIIHRDIKPANIIITSDGLAKIVDFGLAKLAGTKLTKTGRTLGTAKYMSPEQARGDEVDERTDIWSLGIVLYEMIAGKHAFPGEYEQATLYAIANEEPEPLTALRTGVPLELERIVKKALAKKPSERYRHTDEFAVDLKAVARELPSAAGRVKAGPGGRRRRRSLLFALAAGIVVAAIAIIFMIARGRHETSRGEKSVAVLPFKNMSDSKEDEYFSDGITEDIITQLSNIGELKVISRTSVMPYKNTNKNLRQIAKELNVATVLEGSVRRAGNQLRIVAQLIDASNDEHLWAQTYDEQMTQIFIIQSDVAQKIAMALKAEISPREKEQIRKKPTENLEAYAYYLKGREYYNLLTKRDNETAIEFFERALRLDPRFALAYAGLGDAYAQRMDKFGFPRAWADSSIVVSMKAISLDPNLAEGYKALGLAYVEKGWTKRGLEQYRKALEVNPNYSPAVANIGFVYNAYGMFDEGLRWIKKAVASNPTNPMYYSVIGQIYMGLGDYAKAMEWFNKALALQPNFIKAQLDIVALNLRQGAHQEALARCLKVLSLQPDDSSGLLLAGIAELLLGDYAEAERYFSKGTALDSIHGPNTYLGYVYWKTGRKDQARKLFARSARSDNYELAQGEEHWGVRRDLARLNAVQGNIDESYAWLQKAIDAGWQDYRSAEQDPLLEDLRADKRFTQMMADAKAKLDVMRKRVEETDREEAASGQKD